MTNNMNGGKQSKSINPAELPTKKSSNKNAKMKRNKEIQNKMETLAEHLHYEYHKLDHLKLAMNVEKIGDTARSNYKNSSLATVGDAILKAIIAEHLYNKKNTRGDITIQKSKLESNDNLHKVSLNLGLCHYAYNEEYWFDEAPEHAKLPSTNHELYLEAVIGAAFHDLGFDGCKKWVEEQILPKLIECSNK